VELKNETEWNGAESFKQAQSHPDESMVIVRLLDLRESPSLRYLNIMSYAQTTQWSRVENAEVGV
jgi:hypothetical protein